MKSNYFLVLLIGILVFPTSKSFSETELIENYLPYDTVVYMDFKLQNYEQIIKQFLKKIMPPEKLEQLNNRLKEVSLNEYGLDFTDSSVLGANGFDLSERGYFSLFDFKLTKDFSPVFIVALKIIDKSSVKNFVDRLINQVMAKPKITVQHYKGAAINVIETEVSFPLKTREEPEGPFMKKKEAVPEDSKLNLLHGKTSKLLLEVSKNGKPGLYKLISDKSEIDSVIIESFAYAIIDDFLFVGTSLGIKKIIDTKYYRESIKKESDFKRTIKYINQKALIRGYVSYKQLSPIFLTELFESVFGLGFSVDINANGLEVKMASELNPNNAFYYKSKSLYTLSPETNYLLDYLPSGNMSFFNWRINLRKSLQSLSWYYDFYVIYGIGIMAYLSASDSGYYGNKEINYYSFDQILSRNAFDLFKDFIHNIGNDFNFIIFNNKQETQVDPENVNVLFFSEIASKINGYKLINKILAMFKQSQKGLEVEEEKISGHYFYSFKWKSLSVYIGLYKNYLMIATKKNTLTQFLTNIENNKKMMNKTFQHKQLLNQIKKSFANIYVSFKMNQQKLDQLTKKLPQFKILKNIDYVYFNEKRQGDIFYADFRLQFK